MLLLFRRPTSRVLCIWGTPPPIHCRMCSSAPTECSAKTLTGYRERITAVLPRRTLSKRSSPKKNTNHAMTWAARHLSKPYGIGTTNAATPFLISSAKWAGAWIYPIFALRWTKNAPKPCMNVSANGGRKNTSTAANGLSTGACAVLPHCPILKLNTNSTPANCGICAIKAKTARTALSSPPPVPKLSTPTPLSPSTPKTNATKIWSAKK